MLSRNGRPAVSVIVPVFRERAMIPDLLATIEPFIQLHEIVFVDGGSDDGTYEDLLSRGVGRVVRCERGRARQMNHGARISAGHVLLFLHADTSIDPEAPELALREIDRGADGGCFAVRIRSTHRRLELAGALQTARSKVLRSATGDQAIFMRREVFDALGGFDERMSLAEDLNLVKRFLSTRGRRKFICVDHAVTTSGRRWEKSGINRTILMMWGLRIAYHMGADLERVARFYRAVR
jgi:rSAM/selenodomain-associated transferase 2